MRKRYFYTLFTKTEQFLYDGTSSQVAHYMGITTSELSQIFTGRKHSRKYLVKRREMALDEYDQVKRENDTDLPTPKDNKIYDCVVRHLQKYGNTIVCRRKTYVVNRLKNDGINVSCRPGVYGGYWVLEKRN